MKRILGFLLAALMVSTALAWTEEGASGGAGTGDVVGPASSTADALVCFSGTSGKIIKDCFRVTLPAASTGSVPPMIAGTLPSTFWFPTVAPPSGHSINTLHIWDGSDWKDLTKADTEFVEETFVPGILGQTAFTLSQGFKGAGAYASLSVNGQTVDQGVDFAVAGTTLTWFDVKYQLETTDELILKYQIK